MVTMGFLNDIIQAVTRFISGEGIVKVTTPKEERKAPGDFFRKIAKSGRSRQGNRVLFAFTFERNDDDRFTELIEAVEEEYDIQLDPDWFGYDASSVFQTVPFEYPEIEVGKE